MIWSVVWLDDRRPECHWTIYHVNSDVVAVCTGNLVRSIPSITLSPYKDFALEWESKYVCSGWSIAGIQFVCDLTLC
ncbi:hypothetical protein PTT_17410, partial [Pyrenophora teres f. teres 0-1]